MKATRQSQLTKETFLWNKIGHEKFTVLSNFKFSVFCTTSVKQHLHLIKTTGKTFKKQTYLWMPIKLV